MIHGIQEREQLERLHDRHKRLSLEVFDGINTNMEEEVIEERRRELAQISGELDTLMRKLHAHKS